jgi:predicted RNA-binding Zn-ribbon protein involved in translation (DUF1610 family)
VPQQITHKSDQSDGHDSNRHHPHVNFIHHVPACLGVRLYNFTVPALSSVHTRGTSPICSRCGGIGVRSGADFKCPRCGYEANADRNASVNIVIRAGVNHPETKGFFVQSSDGNLSVNGGVLVHHGVGLRCLQDFQSSSRQAHTLLAVGS